MQMDTTVKLRTTVECQSHLRADIAVQDANIADDEPVECEGTDMGSTPADKEIAALVGCANVRSNKCAIGQDVDIGALKIGAFRDFDRRGVTLEKEVDVPFQSVALTLVSRATPEMN